MDRIVKLRAQLTVILKAAPTYLTLVATLVTFIMVALPIPMVLSVGAAVVSTIGAAIAIIRRVTPVVSGERGILPKDFEERGMSVDSPRITV